jgi:hypothetical protein
MDWKCIIVYMMNGQGPSDVICKHCTLKIIKMKYIVGCRYTWTESWGSYDSTREGDEMGV